MKRLYTLMVILCAAAAAMADNYSISGKIIDKQTSQPLPGVGIRLMNADSSYVTGMVTSDLGIFIIRPEKGGKYIVKISSVGYKPIFRDITLTAEKKSTALGTMPLEPSDIALKGATVTAKAAKVEIKGDTFMYNASAYRVPEGAYLESLIDQLPGVEVDDNGGITINGKTVSQIRVDGKDFFKGDNSVAMKNLPADYVKKIKAYEKKSDYTEQTGIDDGNEETVLDLELKQKIKRAWNGNLDLAAGNKDRYSAQGFGVGFTDQSRIALFGTANNVNSRGFGRRGGGSDGLTTNKGLGTNLYWDNGKKNLQKGYFEIGGDVRFNYSSTDRNSSQNSESFFGDRKSSFSNSRSKSLGSSNSLYTNLNVRWNPDSLTTMQFRPSFGYNENDSYSNSLSATFNDDPYNLGANPLDSIFRNTQDPLDANGQLKEIAVNRTSRTSTSESSNHNFGGEMNITRRLNKKGRSLSLSLRGNMSKSTSRSFSLSDIYYYQTSRRTFNNQYSSSPSKNWNYSARLSYSEPIVKNLFFQSSYGYEHRFQDQNRNLYQLDSLDGFGHNGIAPSYPFGYLPSADSLEIAKNLYNSRYATYHDDIHSVNLGVRLANSSMNFSAGVNLQPQRTRLNYRKGELDTVVVRDVFHASPYVFMKYNITKRRRVDLRYNGSSSEPSMTNLLDITDTSDPLHITKGNPGLKPSWTNSLRAEYNDYFLSSMTSVDIDFNYSNTLNSISNAVSYDEVTGVSTTRPENINGNWNMRLGGGFNTSFSENSPFSLSSRTNYRYTNSVGFVSLSNAGSQKSTTRNSNIFQRLKASYRTGLFELSLNGNVNYQHSSNRLQPQANLNTCSFSYSANVQYTSDFGLGISTNIGMDSRRGYADASMNTDELIWNAQLSQSFLKGKSAVVTLQIYDILHRRSNVSRTITAYSRTDSRTNAINSYFLLHFIYKFKMFDGNNGRIKSDGKRDDDRPREDRRPDGEPPMRPGGFGGGPGGGPGGGGPR